MWRGGGYGVREGVEGGRVWSEGGCGGRPATAILYMYAGGRFSLFTVCFLPLLFVSPPSLSPPSLSSLAASWRSAATVADTQAFSDNHTPSSPSLLTHTLSHLAPGETYIFRVNCRNSVGVSCCVLPPPPLFLFISFSSPLCSVCNVINSRSLTPSLCSILPPLPSLSPPFSPLLPSLSPPLSSPLPSLLPPSPLLSPPYSRTVVTVVTVL